MSIRPALKYAILKITASVLIALSGVHLSGCKPYQREVSRNGLLTPYSDETRAQGGQKSAPPPNVHQVFALPEGKIRVVDEDGNVTLYAKSVKHLMSHIIYALENGERDLFVEQIMSKITKQEFYDRNLDPGIAFDELVNHRKDVYKVFHLMPRGENTPGMYLKPLGPNMFRLAASRSGRNNLLWIGIDVSFESSNYKLRWFVR